MKIYELALFCGLLGLIACESSAPQQAAVNSLPVSANISSPDHQISRIQLTGRPELEYFEQGPDDGVPLLLLHGFTDSRHSFDLILPHIADSLKVYAVSLRGHGESGKEADSFTPRDFSADVLAFMDQKQIDRAIIVGHSMGGSIAQRFAIDHPDRCRGLVLAGAFASFLDKPDLVNFKSAVDELQDPVGREFIEEFQASTLHRSVPDPFFQQVLTETAKVPAKVWQQALTALLTADFREELPAIRIPTLILWGDRDVFSPMTDQQILQDSIAGARLLVYEDTGHGLHWERPELFAKDLNTFAGELTE
ncbi:alpha/beta fold hydrolase [Flavilitoribacter nigricans]|uniref:Alpha/beta hydrolase n=1 Tax=Flavilitoribacter nigricans (strain ATCC 23147 / DSM 23189 / NBRC 102662 / NCIMB 1420 / SS-2) TaxID=1122177 RepID=A0A2D0NCA7_FLAN2|nr:alpha/beta hydrolase [Flavilitoribacter nigricans]PHN06125.1 alpha/beta hydrolase [Flavilitoribacter nigricans DSM 23189 = NBRC 102662]